MQRISSDPLALHRCAHDAQADFRQLRQQTKSAFAGILVAIHEQLACHDRGRRVAAELERRILLTADISDALFGLTCAPGRLEERLHTLCTSLVDLLGDPDQVITLHVAVEGSVPAALETLMLRVAHELVGNAVKHGMHMRLVGCIKVTATAGPDGTVLDVIDDGWGFGAQPRRGQGLQVANLLAESHGASVALQRRGEFTIATLCVPGA